MIIDACSNPYEFLIIAGTNHDIKVVSELLSKVLLHTTEYLSANQGYGSDDF